VSWIGREIGPLTVGSHRINVALLWGDCAMASNSFLVRNRLSHEKPQSIEILAICEATSLDGFGAEGLSNRSSFVPRSAPFLRLLVAFHLGLVNSLRLRVWEVTGEVSPRERWHSPVAIKVAFPSAKSFFKFATRCSSGCFLGAP